VTDSLSANAKISIEVSAKELQTLITSISTADKGTKAYAAELDKLEKKLVEFSAATKAAEKSGTGNLAAIKAQEKAFREYASSIKVAAQAQKDLKTAQDKSFGSYAPNMPSAVKGTQNAAYSSYAPNIAASKARDVAEAASVKAAAETASKKQQFNNYVQASNARVATAEQNAVKETQRVVTAERTKAMGQLQINAQQQNRMIDNQVKAAAAAKAAEQAQINGLSNTRYALYDVATTWGIVSTATLGAATAAVAVGISYEKAFAQVERTSGATGGALNTLRDDLLQLSMTKPISFEDITQIGTLAGQLGIASKDISSFTEVVGMFAATTDVAAGTAAEQIGRLAQLTGTAGTEYENLASSIYKTGINAVATESAILSTASQISTAADLAGFANYQIVALASAFASLNIAPERARGSLQRIFGEITSAVNEGGTAVDNFSKVSAMSAAEFSDAWKNDPQKAFSAFVEGLSQTQKNGGDTNQMLKDLGVVAVRDIQALQALANNTDVYNRALEDSASGYKDATALGEGYAIVANTIASRLQVLMQTFQGILASIGKSDFGPLRVLLSVVKDLADGIYALLNNPIGQFVAGTVIALSTLIGLFAAAQAASALATASLFAMITANNALAGPLAVSTTGVRGLVIELFKLSGAAGVSAKGLSGVAVAARGIASATIIGAGITVGLLAISKAVEALSFEFADGQGRAEQYFGELSGLSTALQADTTAFEATGTAIRTIKTDLDNQTIAIGENSAAWLNNAVSTNEEFKKFYTDNKATLAAAGFDYGNFLNAILAGDSGGEEYLSGLITGIDNVREAQLLAVPTTDGFSQAVNTIDGTANRSQSALGGLMKVAQASDGAFADASLTADLLAAGTEALGINSEYAAGGLDEVSKSLQDIIDAEYAITGGTVAVQNSLANLGQSLFDNGTSFDAYSIGGRANLIALQDVVSAMAASSTPDELAAKIAGLMQSLSAMGVNTAGELVYLQNILSNLTGGKGAGLNGVNQAALAATNGLQQGYVPAVRKAAESSRKAAKDTSKAAKEIKTLTDYVSDLSKVFSSAFEIRFGLGQSTDKVADAFRKISDYSEQAAKDVADAAQAIADADAKIRGLNTDSKTLTYQLTVAQEYGDTLRAAEILSKLADNANDVSKAQADRTGAEKDLGKAQTATNKSLTGSTEQSAEQRDMVLSLLEAYHGQVAALANTGMSQAALAVETSRLRAQFVAQLTAMGYSRSEVERYAVSFDDLTLAINRVPRVITVSADVSPGQRAINEFLAANSNKSVNVGLTASGGGTYQANGINVGPGGIFTPFVRTDQINNKKLFNDSVYKPGRAPGQYVLSPSTGGHIAEYHAVGGMAGQHPGKAKGTDTIPAWLTPNEYVHNAQATEYYGLPFMNAINNMQMPRFLASGGPASGSSRGGGTAIQLVELLPTQLAQLASLVSAQVSIDGRVVAEATNRSNTRQATRGAN